VEYLDSSTLVELTAASPPLPQPAAHEVPALS
jgi:hypothetical protein